MGAILQMETALKVPKLSYMVTMEYTLIDRPGTEHDINFLDVIGCFENMEDSKEAIDANAYRIMDNDKQHIDLYKIDLNASHLYSFYRKDLKGVIAKNQVKNVKY